MKRLFSKLFFSIFLVFCAVNVTYAQPVQLPDEYFNDGFGKALSQWFSGQSESVDYNLVEVGSVFEFGVELALDNLWRENKWQVHRVLNFNYNYARGDQFPSPMEVAEIQMAQAPRVTRSLCVDCYYFISKVSDTKKTLILSISGQSLTIWHPTTGVGHQDPGLDLAGEFRKDMQRLLKTGGVYKNGVLEYTGKIRFIQGVDDYSFSWDQFIFPEKVKTQLRQTIEDFINEYDEETWHRLGLPLSRGVLLYGPPGTGKSFVAKVLAANILQKRYKKKISYIHLSARHVDSVDAIRDLYQVARDLAPTILFFEDIDLIAGTGRSDRADIKNELMQQLSGLEELRGVMTIGTTNVIDRIDPALKRSQRLGYQFEIGAPTFSERIALFQVYLKGVHLLDVDLSRWASETENFTGADIRELCELAVDRAVREGRYDAVKNIVSLKNEDLVIAYEVKIGRRR